VCECFTLGNGYVTEVEIGEFPTGAFEIDLRGVPSDDSGIFESVDAVSNGRTRDVGTVCEGAAGGIAGVVHECVEDSPVDFVEVIVEVAM
jgi:hypothetical protein